MDLGGLPFATANTSVLTLHTSADHRWPLHGKRDYRGPLQHNIGTSLIRRHSRMFLYRRRDNRLVLPVPRPRLTRATFRPRYHRTMWLLDPPLRLPLRRHLSHRTTTQHALNYVPTPQLSPGHPLVHTGASCTQVLPHLPCLVHHLRLHPHPDHDTRAVVMLSQSTWTNMSLSDLCSRPAHSLRMLCCWLLLLCCCVCVCIECPIFRQTPSDWRGDRGL